MSDPYMGEVRLFAGTYAPRNFSFCNGTLLATSQNGALFSLLGAAYGGDGATTFALPDLQGRVPIGMGSGTNLTPRTLGSKGGVEETSLSLATMPAHTHTFMATSSAADTQSPQGALLGTLADPYKMYIPAATLPVEMNANSLYFVGQGNQFGTLGPTIYLNYIIALLGTYPPHPS